MRQPLLFTLAMVLFSAKVSATPPPSLVVDQLPLTAEELFRTPSLNRVELSGDGQHLGAILTDENDLHHLLITNLKDQTRDGLLSDSGFNLSSFRWLDNNHVLFGATKEKIYAAGLF